MIGTTAADYRVDRPDRQRPAHRKGHRDILEACRPTLPSQLLPLGRGPVRHGRMGGRTSVAPAKRPSRLFTSSAAGRRRRNVPVSTSWSSSSATSIARWPTWCCETCRTLIAETDALLGAWQRSRGYKCREIYLAAKLFCGPLRTAFATLLHEASHLFGDGREPGLHGFAHEPFRADFRTAPGDCGPTRKRWVQLRKQVQAERIALAPAASPADITPATTVDAVFRR